MFQLTDYNDEKEATVKLNKAYEALLSAGYKEERLLENTTETAMLLEKNGAYAFYADCDVYRIFVTGCTIQDVIGLVRKHIQADRDRIIGRLLEKAE